jgi:hypothetical protein
MNKRALIVIVVATAIVVTAGGAAFAKGPESATLTGPGIDKPIELINKDPDFVRQLLQQSGIWSGPALREPIEPAGYLGPAYTLTWINSGPPEAFIEERSIRQILYPYAENGPLINTPAQVGLVGWGGEVLGWYEAPKGLIDTLVALGVPVPPPTSDADTAAAPESEGKAAAATSPGHIVSVDNEPDYLVYLAIGGVGLVLALTWAARRRQSI